MSNKEKGFALIAVIVLLNLIAVVIKGMQPVSLADRSTAKPSPIESPKVCRKSEGRINEMGTLYSDSACTEVFGIITEIQPGKVVVSVVDRSTSTDSLQILDRAFVKAKLYVKD